MNWYEILTLCVCVLVPIGTAIYLYFIFPERFRRKIQKEEFKKFQEHIKEKEAGKDSDSSWF